MGTWYPEAFRLPITTREYFPSRVVPLVGIVDHITAGNDSRNYGQNVANNSSYSFLVRPEGVYQFMPLEWAAWGNGIPSGDALSDATPPWVRELWRRDINVNHATVSIEHEQRLVGPFPETILARSERLHRWLARRVPTLVAARSHVIGHYQVNDVDRPFCPGGEGGKHFPFDRMVAAMVDERAPREPGFPYEAVVITPANFRSRPGFVSNVSGILPVGDKVRVLDSEGGWRLVQRYSNLARGWVSGELLRPA